MLSEKHREALKNIEPSVAFDDDSLNRYGKDWTHLSGKAGAVLFPKDTAQVAKLLAYCHQHDLAVIPSGGRTGLAGAAVATKEEVVISLAKMNKIIAVDTVGRSITVEAGAITQTVQEKAKEAGLFFPVDLAAKGSCQIGGNIATNAGGLKLIRYGGMRDHVLGLEVVLSDGKVLDLNYNLLKDNTGYDLKHLFIGSEGTLGVITKATIRLMAKPHELKVACLACNDFKKITQILEACNLRGISPSAFEFFTREALDVVLAHQKTAQDPFGKKSPFYVLLETEHASAADQASLESLIEECYEKDLLQNAVFGESSQDFAKLWSLRENISESVAVHGLVRKNDISVAISELAPFYEDLLKIMATAPKEISLLLFGHVGDGNIHINYSAPHSADRSWFVEAVKGVENRIFQLLKAYRGSISAEHGIGLLKKDSFKETRSGVEIDLMRRIKQVFDPKNLLNPGKIFD